jgi:hypothetical protein
LLWLRVSYAARAVFEPEAVTVHFEDVNVVGVAIKQCTGQTLGTEDAGLVIERQIAGNDDRAALVSLAEDFEQ